MLPLVAPSRVRGVAVVASQRRFFGVQRWQNPLSVRAHPDDPFHRICAPVREVPSDSDSAPAPFGDISVMVKDSDGTRYVRAFGRALPPIVQSGVFGVSLFRPYPAHFDVTHSQLPRAMHIARPRCVILTAPMTRTVYVSCPYCRRDHDLGILVDSQITRKRGRHGMFAVGDHAVLYPLADMSLDCYKASVAAVELSSGACSAFPPKSVTEGSGGPAGCGPGASGSYAAPAALGALCTRLCHLVSGSSIGGHVIHAACVALAELAARPGTHPGDAVTAAVACSQLALSEASEHDLATAEPSALLAALGYALHAVDLPPFLEDAADVARVHVYNAFGVPIDARRFQVDHGLL